VKFWPKKLFQWRQPREFLTLMAAEEKARRKWWAQAVGIGAIAGMLLLQRLFVDALPNKHPPSWPLSVIVAFGAGGLFVYGIPWMIGLFPADITILETAITSTRNPQHPILWAALRAFSWRHAETFSTLILVRKKGRPVLLGVPKDAPVAEVSAFLRERGLEETAVDAV
jgi:hypothetical protein